MIGWIALNIFETFWQIRLSTNHRTFLPIISLQLFDKFVQVQIIGHLCLWFWATFWQIRLSTNHRSISAYHPDYHFWLSFWLSFLTIICTCLNTCLNLTFWYFDQFLIYFWLNKNQPWYKKNQNWKTNKVWLKPIMKMYGGSNQECLLYQKIEETNLQNQG